MKNARQLAALAAIAAIILTATAVNATEGVSPGAGDRLTVIRDGCPTLSWGEVDGAAFYEVVAYRLPEGQDFAALAGFDLAETDEVLYTRVSGKATGWTPDHERCFAARGNFVWFVRAVFDDGDGLSADDWSQGLYFSVTAAPSAAEVRQALGVLQRYLAEGGGGTEELVGLISDVDAGPAHRTRNTATNKLTGRVLPGTAAIKGEQTDPTGETYGVYGVTNSSTDGSIGVVGEATAETGEASGVSGITASADGAGVIAFNAAGGTDLLLGAGDSSAHLTELGLTRWLPGAAAFDINNPDGAGSMTLRVDGVDVVTTATDRDALGDLGCASGEVAKWNGSQWVCGPDADSTYSNGNQLDLVGTTFNVVEGPDSGLDADTFDSHNSDHFATADHTHALTFGQNLPDKWICADCYLNGIDLMDTTLQYAYLRRSSLRGARFDRSDIRGADFYSADINHAIFVDGQLGRAQFSQADCGDALFNGAFLEFARFSAADLSGADFSDSNLSGATGLDSATLVGVVWANTTCPDGTNSDSNGMTCEGHLIP